MRVFLNFIILGRGLCPPDPNPHHFSKLNFISKILKFYCANQRVSRRHKNKRWSEWATFEEYWHALKYKALLISTSTNFLQPSRNFIKQHSETVMVWKYQNADCSSKNDCVIFIYYSFRHTFVPYLTRGWYGLKHLPWLGWRKKISPRNLAYFKSSITYDVNGITLHNKHASNRHKFNHCCHWLIS